MFFKNISVNNYGSIDSFHYSFRFNDEGKPIPLVLIGGNGSGKTLVLSNLVDSLIELKRKTFYNNLLEVSESNYFKIGSKNYIKNRSNTSCVVVTIDSSGKEIKYTDIMSFDPSRISDDSFVIVGDIKDIGSFQDSGFYKNVQGEIKEKDYSSFISLYFPADRFYLPMWYNNENYKRIDYSNKAVSGKPKTNMIKSDILSNIKDWLVDVYMQSEYQLINFGDADNIPVEYRGKTLRAVSETHIQQLVTSVFNSILGNASFQHTPMNRKNQLVSLSAQSLYCKDIDQLSEGQMSLFAIALSIIKEWDIDHDNFSLEDINGIAIIDEADLGLHIDYAHEAFPRMMRLFPNVQFIITTHSPFMISGLLDSFGDNIDVISMPDGIKIKDVELFGEMKKARAVFNSGIEKQKREINDLQRQIQELKTLTNQVVVYTEGDTDRILLEKALEELGVSDLQVTIQPASSGNGNKSDSAIKRLLLEIQNNPSVSNKLVIGMFDRDSKTKLKNATGIEIDLNQTEYAKLGEQLYAFSIPVPHNRPEEDQISIEHYFTDEEIKRKNEKGQRLFIGNEFNKTGNHKSEDRHYHYIEQLYTTIKIIEHETKKFVTDQNGDGDYSLSKSHFAEAVRDDRPNFNDFDFSEFNKIFDIIKKIIEDAHLAAEEA